VPRPFGLWAWVGGLTGLFVLAVLCQGPWHALKLLFDLPGHILLLARSVRRLFRAGRLVATICGVTILAWTANQIVSFHNRQGDADLTVLLSSKSLREVVIEQGVLAGLTPMRDLFCLADLMPLLILGAALAFRLSADRWGAPPLPGRQTDPAASGWITLYWGSAWLYVLYRLGAMIDPGDLPLGGCLFPEAAIVPGLMLFSDGLLLAWVLVELRNVAVGSDGSEPLEPLEALALVPAATLACLAALPARYAATGALLGFLHVPTFANGVPLWAYKRLAWGLVAMQGAALCTCGLAGAAAWSRGRVVSALRLYFRTLRGEGGHLVGVLTLSSLAAAGLAGLGYAALLSLPHQAWVLTAADSYSHYATLPIGLVTLSALIELSERTLPFARATEAASVASRAAVAAT
jgi:hypothetical protein